MKKLRRALYNALLSFCYQSLSLFVSLILITLRQCELVKARHAQIIDLPELIFFNKRHFQCSGHAVFIIR